MIALSRLKVSHFKNLVDVDVELGALNVLVGPNGAGKSNLLSVIAFLGESVRRDLGVAVAQAGGLSRLMFRGSPTRKVKPARKAKPARKIPSRWIQIEVHAQVTTHASPTAQDEYVLKFRERLGVVASSILQREETFKFKRTRGVGRRITVRGQKFTVQDGNVSEDSPLAPESLGLSTLPRLGEAQGARQVGQIASLFSTFRIFEVDVERARAPSRREPTAALDADAGNLAAFLAYLAEEHPEIFARIEDDMRAIVPGIDGLSIEEVGGAGRGLVVVLRESGLGGVTWLSEASFGTVRALALLAMLHDPDPPKLTCAEEIDHGLHPYALDVIVDRLREASERTQLILATHSPTLVNRLTARELIVCERDPDSGAAKIPAISTADVEAMEEALDGRVRLGELWFSGSLGGVPG